MNSQPIEDIRESILHEIVGCYNCQPYESGDPIWLGPHTDIYDLLIDYDLTEEEITEVIDDMSCPNCGTSITSPTDEVEIKTEFDRQVDKVFERIEDSSIIRKLYEFNDFLSEYPYLGAHPSNSTSEEIIHSVKNGKTYSIDSKVWYRARLLNTESRLFLSSEMSAPNPIEVFIKEGRYNHTGQSFLYLSEFETTAFKEIKKTNENICAIQKFKIINIDKILDIRQNYNNIDPNIDIIYWAIIYNGFLQQPSNKQSSWKPEYFVPRFIADAARFYNYNGIIYSSAVADGSNLALFTFKDECVFPEGNSYIYVNDQKAPINLFL